MRVCLSQEGITLQGMKVQILVFITESRIECIRSYFDVGCISVVICIGFNHDGVEYFIVLRV